MSDIIIEILLRICIICKASMLGWNIKKMSSNEIIISKKINNMNNIDNNLEKLLDFITNI